MIPWTQKPGRAGDDVGRPRTGTTPIQHIRIPEDDWIAFKTVTGRGAAGVIRDFVRWYLHRPGARLPQRPSKDAVVQHQDDDDAGTA